VNLPPSNDVSSAEQARWFAEEVQPHEPALRRWLRNQYPALGDVDDVVHESYLNLLRKQPTGRIAFTKAYLFAAARNAALRVFRKNRIYSDTPVNDLPDWQLLDGGGNAADFVNVHQEDDLVAEAIAQLPERCREIVKLRAIHGLSYLEIATRLDVAEATVRVQIARGIKKCAHFLRERGVRQDV
jgi:RNA polymerase sigma factor (sigma-70 family)